VVGFAINAFIGLIETSDSFTPISADYGAKHPDLRQLVKYNTGLQLAPQRLNLGLQTPVNLPRTIPIYWPNQRCCPLRLLQLCFLKSAIA
jgi:hypothetical protein